MIKFIRELEDQKVTEVNIAVTLECEISKEGLKVEWYRKDKKLRRDDKYDIVVDGKVHRLIINNVTSEDVGQYSAVYEKLKTNAKLSVAGELCLCVEIHTIQKLFGNNCKRFLVVLRCKCFFARLQLLPLLEPMSTLTDWY